MKVNTNGLWLHLVELSKLLRHMARGWQVLLQRICGVRTGAWGVINREGR